MKTDSPFKKIYITLVLLLFIIAVGTIGYMFIEKYSFVESFYLTVVTITTVGLGGSHPLSREGMIFTSFLIIVSFAIFAFVISAFTEFIVEGIFHDYFHIRSMQKKIDKLNNHIIICGYGRNGLQAARELREENIPIVVIENDEARLENFPENDNSCYIIGDATHDDVLQQAGIERAKALLAVLPNDAENVFLVLTARELNPKIMIISKASDEGSEIKLRRAGASHVILPDKMSGKRMARMVARPDIVEFIDLLMSTPSSNVVLDEVPLDNITDYFNGRTLRELEKFNDTGAKIIGIKQHSKSFIINPLPETILSPRDKLFALGTLRQINQLKDLISNPYIKE
jgi:voltage-gated potassium channel